MTKEKKKHKISNKQKFVEESHVYKQYYNLSSTRNVVQSIYFFYRDSANLEMIFLMGQIGKKEVIFQ